MDQARLLELGRGFAGALQALERGEEGALEEIVGLFAEDARLTNAALKLTGEERVGRDGVRAFWEEYRHTFREARTEFAHYTAGDGAAGLFWTTRGADATGAPVEYDGVSLLVFADDGLIARFRGYYDTRELSRVVGG